MPGPGLYTSEFDVYRRQILTYKDGPRTERVNKCTSSCTVKPLYVLLAGFKNHSYWESNEWLLASRFPNVWSQFKQILSNFHPLEVGQNLNCIRDNNAEFYYDNCYNIYDYYDICAVYKPKTLAKPG